jgi:hypothetical protein
MLGDGRTPAANVAAMLTATGGTLACGAASCPMTTDAQGMVSTVVTPLVAGTVLLSASSGGGSAGASFTAVVLPPDGLSLVSVPVSGGYVGTVASGTFTVKVALGDGTVGAGEVVTLTVAGGTIGACGATSCVVRADAAGMVATTVMPTRTGLVALTAAAGGGSVSGSFTVVAAPVDVLTVLSSPANGAYVGDVAATPLRVQVTLGDGAAAAGATVTLTATGAILGACAAASCIVTADGAGTVTTTVTPSSAGLVGLRASAGGGVVTASLTAVNHVQAVTMVQPVEYVAAGAVVNWTPQAIATVDSIPVAVAFNWTGGPGIAIGPNGVVIGPLPAGGSASGSVCAWSNVCTPFFSVVVDEAAWQIMAVSGDGQTLPVGGAFNPLVARVVDGAGHGVAGVPVTVHQVVNGYVSCPGTGRCPVGPQLGASTATVSSDADGLVSVVPLVFAGVAETTAMVLTAGDNGFFSTNLSMAP